MLNIIHSAKAYGVYEALPVSLAAAAVYLIVRVVLIKANVIKRKAPVSEAAGVLLAGYIAALLMIVWISRWRSWYEFAYNIAHFGDLWRDGWHYTNNRRVQRFFSDELLGYERFEVLANVALFVPLGFLLPIFWRKLRWWQVDLICAGTTCVVELIQPLIDGMGDLDDLIANTLGGIVGCALAKIVIFARNYVKNRKKSGQDT